MPFLCTKKICLPLARLLFLKGNFCRCVYLQKADFYSLYENHGLEHFNSVENSGNHGLEHFNSMENKLYFKLAKHCFSQKGSFGRLCGFISGHYLSVNMARISTVHGIPMGLCAQPAAVKAGWIK